MARRTAHLAIVPLTGLVVATALLLGPGVGRASAQVQIRDFPKRPILVLNPGGHTAPVRSLIFADADLLLSGGMDKVVHAWDLRDGRASLARTIRPPIWRGPRGWIYAMALSPAAGGGERLLAVAGLGVERQGGNITLYHYPGAGSAPTGEVARTIPSGTDLDPQAGHTDTVMTLAFDPNGRDLLASGGLDGTVRLWEPSSGRALAVLRGHAGAVNALAFRPDGRRLISGGVDGVVRLWDVDKHRLVAQVPSRLQGLRPDDPAGGEILALAVSPEGRWVVVGRENGLLERQDAATLGNEISLNAGDNARGPIEALAFSHDGTRLAVSVVSRRNEPAERPRPDCDVEIRSMPDGRDVARIARASNLVYALAFRPDDRVLAFAGGDAQGVHLADLVDADRPILTLEGRGRSVWEVAFSADSRAVAYSRSRRDGAGAASEFEAFDLEARRPADVDPQALRGPVGSMGEWTIRPTGPWSLEVVNAQGQGYRLDLDPVLDRRWWSYSFLPPGPGHGQWTVGVGCEGGVVIYAYDPARRQYRRSRYLAGHTGPVYALAPSPDGRWLATGSSDQTVRIWRLAGADIPAPLGVRLGRIGPDGGLPVEAVEPRGFAEAMGLDPGDVIVEAYHNARRLDLAQVEARVEAEPPGTSFEFRVRRGAELVNVGTNRRDGPALSLFPGLDREWVLWMPEGYYDTSIVGDRKYLGWQRNRANLQEPTDYFSADKFERELRRIDVLERLWATADPAQALALLADPGQVPAEIVEADRPPSIRIVEPIRPPDVPLVVRAAALPIRALASSEGARPIRSIRVLIDSRLGPTFAFPAGQAEVDQPTDLVLTPGLHRINVVATNDRDKERTESFDILYEPPDAPRLPRLVVKTVGVGEFPDAEALDIRYAARDAEGVGTFLSGLGRPRASEVDLAPPLVDADAKARAIRAILAGLDAECTSGDLQPGDTVVLMLESHTLNGDAGTFLVGSEARPDGPLPPADAIPASEVGDALGRLADYGCRVLLLLDAVHETAPDSWESDIKEWARDLWKRNVIAFVASNDGPGRRLGGATRRGAFAQGILESLDAPTRSRLWADPDGPLTLADFQEAVVQRVQDLTARRQFPNCYVPETIPSRLPIFDPHPPEPDAVGPPVAIGNEG